MSATQQPHSFTASELALCVKFFRHLRQWSQEQLATLSGLSVRTVQRVENSKPSDFDTRRAIARAFEFEDIDALNKPYAILSEGEMKAEQERFERENITLEALPLTTGKQLAGLVETTSMDLSAPAFEMTREADEKFAALIDYFCEYRDCAELYSEVRKFEVYDEMQCRMDALRAMSISLCYSIRELLFKVNDDPAVKPLPMKGLYVLTFTVGNEPKQFTTARAVAVRGYNQ